MDSADVVRRNNVVRTGADHGRPVVFAHGFGCDQQMWRLVAPAVADEHPVVLYDQVGAGGSDVTAYEPEKYDSLRGYAQDLVEICEALQLQDAVVVAHSVSAMVAVLASADTTRIGALVLVGPSPRYVDDPSADYVGGFSRSDIDALLDSMSDNYLGWAAVMGPLVMGHDERPELAGELTASFCRTDPEIARHFAQTTFLSDNRPDLAAVRVPTLVLQCTQDTIAPPAVGQYVHQHISGSRLELIETSGHCPHLSAPQQTLAALQAFLARP